MQTFNRNSTKTIVLGAILTALVFVLQFMGSFIKFGLFSISLVLIPIVIGAATCSVKVSTWLGFIFGVAVLISGDAAAFLALNVAGTIITVLAKGTLCGLFAGLIYKAFEKKNRYLAVIAAAIVCPVTNTGVFFIGCLVFFIEQLTVWANAWNAEKNVIEYIILVLIGGNFIFELITDIILSPVVVRLLNIKNKN